MRARFLFYYYCVRARACVCVSYRGVCSKLASYRVFGQVYDLSASAVKYYRDRNIPIEGPLAITNVPGASNVLAAAGPLSQLVKSAAPVIRSLGSGASKVGKSSVVTGGASGIGGAGLLSEVSKGGTGAIQGLGFGTGYGVGVRAGYELGFPSLFGEEKTAKRAQVVQQGFSQGPLFDILRTISGGADLGLKNGQRQSGASQDDFTEFHLGAEPPQPSLTEGIGFQESIDVQRTGTGISIPKGLTRTAGRSLGETYGVDNVIAAINQRIDAFSQKAAFGGADKLRKNQIINNWRDVRNFLSG